MRSIIKLALAATLVIFAQNVNAQKGTSETKKERKARKGKEAIEADRAERKLDEEQSKKEQLAYLKEKRSTIESYWKSTLKSKIEQLNNNTKTSNKTPEEIDLKKKEIAQEIALNIQNQLSIIDNQIALVERTGYLDPSRGTQIGISLGGLDENGNRVVGVAVNGNQGYKRTYDRRTYGESVFAMGLNNVTSDNAEIGDDFSIGRSTFVEWGYAWKTRVLKNSGALQFKYGLSLQSNFLSIKDNRILDVTDGVTRFETFPSDLKKAKIRVTNLVVPLHIEFGGWKKEEGEDYVRYRIGGKFRMGIGGYAGVRLGTQQKLKYKADGERIKSKSRQDFGGDNFVYGISSYVRVTGDLSLYAKYDLSSAFNTQSLGDVNNVSLGLRLDL